MSFRNIAAALFFSLGAAACSAEEPASGPRMISDGVLVSTENPALTFTPSDEFDYVGDFAITLKDAALAERYHWVVAQNGRVEKMLIVQFEGFLDGVEGGYNIAIPSQERAGSNYKFTDEPVLLDGKPFVHNTWALNQHDNAESNPGMEAEATLALLTEEGYSLDEGVIMSRFGSAIGDDARHELIIFYYEPLADSGKTLDAFPDGEPLTDEYEMFSDAVTARSLDAFTVEFTED